MHKIGDIIREHRLSKNLTQEELGKKLFVSKQAVSKWETGRTTPDIETIRTLCDILEINNDEILGGSITEVKTKRNWLKISIAITVLCLIFSILFSTAGGFEYVRHYTQASVCFLTVFSNGELLTADEYTVENKQDWKNYGNGYKTRIDYGEVGSIIKIYDDYEIEYGFTNLNKWHNVQIRLDIEETNGQLTVRQTVCYETENNFFEVYVTKASTSTEKYVSVYRGGA